MNRAFKFALLLGLAVSANAHRLDEYLQASLIEIGSREISVQLNLTPGVDVFEQVIKLIDANGDGRISSAEATGYAKSVVAQLAIHVDDRPLKLEYFRNRVDPIADLKSGNGTIRIEMRARVRELHAGKHLLSFENHHLPEISVYLVNALVPKDRRIEVTKQERNKNQSIGRIHFALRTGKTAPEARPSTQ